MKTLNVSPRAANSRKSKSRSDKAVISLQSNKEMTFHVNVLLEIYASLSKNTFYDSTSASVCSRFVLNFPSILRLVFLQTCSYKSVHFVWPKLTC